ncbi:hypothetical protein KHP62_00615 [Rhodobacteraceae bacterium NNCM2]|nr:hypothetical protein [Coraliihabitans acroporae]
MRHLVALILIAFAQQAAAQSELQIFGAMVEGPDGAPLATATAIGGTPGKSLYLTSAEAAETAGACLRVWDQGACHEVIQGAGGPVDGLGDLAIVAVSVPNEEMVARFTELQMNALPAIGIFDPATDARQVQFLTQSALGGWESPIDPAAVSGQSARGFNIQSPGLSTLSIGAPVTHQNRGLVGVIAAAQPGAARVVAIDEAIDAVIEAGFPVPPEMRPRGNATGELPSAVENEMGRVYVFQDNSSIPNGLTGFYGPSDGVGFDPNFVTSIDYSVWGINLDAPSGSLLATGDKTLPLVPTGMALEAPFKGTPSDFVATCVMHETPTSAGRRAMVMQFWRSVPERFNPNIGTKSYDEAAPPLTGWADGASPCADRLARLDTKRIAALRGTVLAEESADTAEAEPWHWGVVDAGNGINVSGVSGASRANIFCYRLNGRLVGGVAMFGDILAPVAGGDVTGGWLNHHVGGQRFAARLIRAADQIALKDFQEGEAFLNALDGADEIMLEWEDANGLTPLGRIDLTGAQEYLAQQRAACDLPGAATGLAGEAVSDGWTEIGEWAATGRAATSIDLAEGRKLILGCTESREVVLALSPPNGVSGFLIGGRGALESGEAEGMAYGFFAPSAWGQLTSGASIGFQIDGAAMDLPAPAGLDSGQVGAACRN